MVVSQLTFPPLRDHPSTSTLCQESESLSSKVYYVTSHCLVWLHANLHVQKNTELLKMLL